MKKFLKQAIYAAEESGSLLLNYFKKIENVSKKNENLRDLVTEVDLVSEKTILRILKSKFNKHNFLAEESGFENNKSHYTWVIDPLDGTVNYTKGIGICVISIALTYKQESILGVIYNPFTQELFYASKGNGAFLNGDKITVSSNKKIKKSLLVCAFSASINNRKKKEYSIFGKLNNDSLGVLRIGSAAYALALLAKGSIDGFWGYDLYLWDVQAGICLVNEAKGSSYQANKKKNSVNLICGSCNSIIKEIKKYQ